MNTASVLKNISKTILWIVVIFVLIFLVIAGIIQIPSIQTRLVQYATTFVSNKTHTIVEIEKISISFPKSVVIEGLFLEDEKKDTLIYAGTTKINIALLDLFQNKIAISSFDLENVSVKLHSTKTDPLFNYNFLITAFADTTTQTQPDSVSASKWTFGINNVSLKNLSVVYNDAYAGMNVSVILRNSVLHMDEIDMEKSIYKIDKLVLDGLTTNLQMSESKTISNSNTENVLPKIGIQELQLNNATINFTDSVGNLSILSVIDACKLESASIDLQKQLLASESVSLSKSEIKYHTFAPELTTKEIVPASENNWEVSMNRIELTDNTLHYKSGNKPDIKNVFNPDNLTYYHLSLDAIDFQYSSNIIKASIKKFSAIDQNNFAIQNFSTDFRMDPHSIVAHKIKVGTSRSTLDADFSLHYSSMASLIDSMQFDILSLDLKNARIANSDILYFNPLLRKQPFFQNRSTLTSASGKINGKKNSLSGKNLSVKTGNNTNLKTDFNITGLSDFQTATFEFPHLVLNSGKKDIVMLAGKSLPENIELPEKINLTAAFKGQIMSFETTVKVSSSFGNANLIASIDPNEKFSGNINLSNFDLGKLLNDTVMLGPVSLTAELNGKGLDLETMQANIKAEATALSLNKYTYHKLKMEASVAGQVFDGKISLKDENADLDMDGHVNLNASKENYQLHLNILGADLQKLNFTNDDIRIGMVASANFKGKTVDNLCGEASISNIIVAREDKIYNLESLVLTTLNEPNKSEFVVSSPLVDIKYYGHVFPSSLSSGLSQFLNSYFPFSDSISEEKQALPNFNFEIQLHNHPLISEVLFPEIQEFQPGVIQGSFDSTKNKLKLNASINKITYGTTDINDFSLVVNSDSKALNYQLSCRNISNSLIRLNNFLIDGKLADNKISTSISSVDDTKNKKLAVTTQIIKEKANYKLTLDPDDFYIMYEKWNIAADNSIEFGEQGFLIRNFFLKDHESQLHIASVNNTFNDDIHIGIHNFALDHISGIFQKDTNLIKGIVDGTILLKRVNDSYGLIADTKIMDLVVSNIPIGNLTIKAENPTTEKFNIDLKLTGAENNLTANGFYVPNGGDQSIRIYAAIQSLSLQTVQAFSMGFITKATGNLTGNFLVDGNTSMPEITGELSFHNAFITPAFLKNPLEIKQETFHLKKDGFYFNSFTILDPEKHRAILDGVVTMNQFSDFKFALNIDAKDFLLINTTHEDNKEFYGRMIIDSKIAITGPMSLPVVNAKIKLKKGSSFTFAVPEEQLTTDKGEDVVEFETKTNINSILYRAAKKEVQKSSLTGFDVSSILEIDKEAKLRLLMDPASTDSLVVRGDAALSFTIDRSGKMSLTGAYNLNDGSYMASLESLIKRKFDIDRGSTIFWNGDPYDAEISINTRYMVRASPIDLMSDQMSGLSEADKNGYKQRYPFLVLLKLRGKILQPEISFEIQLPSNEKGILGGAVNQKLSMLNEDESSLNKQVFALLVLGRFIQENPLQTEAGSTSSLVRATVGKFLSQQLNQWSSKVLPGVDLNFDIQSYNDYETGESQGRTQVDIGLKKQLFDERLSIQLGGSVDVEGEKASQNSASNITSDVDVEYKLTKDGRYRLKGFRHNQYEGVIEGQLVETGVGVIYVRDFNSWKKKPPKSPKGRLKKAILKK